MNACDRAVLVEGVLDFQFTWRTTFVKHDQVLTKTLTLRRILSMIAYRYNI